MIGFPTRTPAQLEVLPREQGWLVEELWGHQAVGIIGGEPKCGKTFLALALAVAVASGVPCLGRFPVAQSGTVLMYVAEDGEHLVRWRLEDTAAAAGIDFESLDIAVIDAPVLRLDDPGDRQRLHDTVGRIAPRLLILDPMVRLHTGDENSVTTIAPILGFLRGLQRQFATGVALVHHARKSAASRPGQALRGSGDFHAWGDSNVYLRRQRNGHILMNVEHRAAADREDVELEFTDAGEGAALRLCRDTAPDHTPTTEPPRQRILGVLMDAGQPLSQRQVRERAGTRHATVGTILEDLVREGSAKRDSGGYRIVVAGTKGGGGTR